MRVRPFIIAHRYTYNEDLILLEGKIAVLEPQAKAFERIAVAEGSMCVTDAAKSLQMSPRSLFTWMRRNQWIYDRAGLPPVAYQLKLFQGLLEHKLTTIPSRNDAERAFHQVRVTMKGLAKLALALGVPLPSMQGSFPSEVMTNGQHTTH